MKNCEARLFCVFLLPSLLLLNLAAHARCSNPIQVPVAVYSYSVVVKDKQFSGILPEVLSAIEAKSKCRFVYSLVPKNRQEILFETGQSDLLVNAVKTARRDQLGIFFSFIQLRATLISIDGQHPSFHSTKDLFTHREAKLVIVRAYDYGPAYQEIVAEMQKMGRVIVEPDPISVAKLMKTNPKYVTIMAPTIFSGLVQTDATLIDLVGKIRYEKLEQLPWNDSGVYISKTSLSTADQRYLKTQFEKYANLDDIRRAYQKYYPPEVIRLGIRASESKHP